MKYTKSFEYCCNESTIIEMSLRIDDLTILVHELDYIKSIIKEEHIVCLKYFNNYLTEILLTYSHLDYFNLFNKKLDNTVE